MKRQLLNIILLLALAGPAFGVSTVSRVKTWGVEVLTSADLNAEFDNLKNYVNNQVLGGTNAITVPAGDSSFLAMTEIDTAYITRILMERGGGTSNIGELATPFDSLFVFHIQITDSAYAAPGVRVAIPWMGVDTVSTDSLTVMGPESLDGDLGFVGPQAITTSSGALTVTPTTDTHFSNGTGVVVGHTAQLTTSTGDGATDLIPEIQEIGTGQVDASALLAAFSTTATRAAAPTLVLAKGGAATVAVGTALVDDEIVGSIIAVGDDGTDLESPAAAIEFAVDADVGTGDMPGRIVAYTTADAGETLTEALRIDSSQRLFTGGETANTFMSAGGLTLDQNGADNNLIALKSSDIGHAMTGIAETDTYAYMEKAHNTGGGLSLRGLTDANSNGYWGIRMMGIVGEALSTTKTTLGRGAVGIEGAITDGGTSVADPAANSNLVQIGKNGTTTHIFDSNGDSHQDVGTAWTNFDHEPDHLITRSLGIVMDPESIVRSRWDDWGRDNKEDLIRTGIIPRLTEEQAARGERALVNVTQVMRVHNGAIWQTYEMVMEDREAMKNQLFEIAVRLQELAGENEVLRAQVRSLTRSATFKMTSLEN